MGWSGSITSSTAVNSSITYTPDTSTQGTYTMSRFSPGKEGIYRFQLYGSGGRYSAADVEHPMVTSLGGNGGYVDYYLLMTSTQNTSVYVGAGGPCSAAFIANKSGSSLREVMNGSTSPIYAIAGGGGGGAVIHTDDWNGTGYNAVAQDGGVGGGASGGNSYGKKYVGSDDGGSGGTQTGAGSQGWDKGGLGYGGYHNDNVWGGGFGGLVGRGGDGLYGGNSGTGNLWSDDGYHGAEVTGGGGGSSYINNGFGHTFSYNGRTFTNGTTSGGGSGNNSNGRIVITLVMEANGTPTPPTSVWLNKTTADTLSETCYLSWNGASGGYLNRITGYNIYRNGSLYKTVSASGTSYSNCPVVAPDTPDGSYTYTVATNVISTQDNATTKTSTQSSGVVLKTTTRTVPSAPTEVLINRASPCYIGNTGLTTLTLSWTASKPGIYNTVSGYNVYRNGKFLAKTTNTSYSLMSLEDHIGTYTVYAIGSAGGNSTASKGVEVKYITAPASMTMKLYVPEVTARDIPLKWNSVTAPTGSTISYFIQYHPTYANITDEAEITATNYTFSIEKILVGRKFDLLCYTKANASGGSYTLSPVVTIETGRVGIFNLPSTYDTFWVKVYDPASTLTGRQSHAYQSISLIWAPATPSEASGTIYTYTLKCKVGSSAWNDIYTITKAPEDEGYGENLSYSYSLANISENMQVSFYVLVKDNFNTEVSSAEAVVIKLAVPSLSGIGTNITYRKAAINFTALPTTNGLDDPLVYTVYFSHNNKEAQYGQATITNQSGIVSGLSYEFKVEDGKNANTNTFLGAIYDTVITNKKPYPTGTARVKIHYKSYPNCYTTSSVNITYNFLHEIDSAPKITYTLPSAHSTYCNPLDEVTYNFTPIGWTDAAGSTIGATITYTMAISDSVDLINPQLPNTKYTTTMPSSFSADGIMIYTLTTKIIYGDGTIRSNTTSINFNIARWYSGDVLLINSPRQIAGTVTGNYSLPSTLWRSEKYNNLTKVVLEIYNSDRSQSYAASKVTVTDFTASNLLVPFTFDGVDEGSDLVVCARAVCTNTSGRTITIFSSYYVIRSSAVTMALRKGSLGLNVSDDFNPSDTESTLYINAKPKGESPVLMITDDADQPSNGQMIGFQHGLIDYGSFDTKNGLIIGRGMGKELQIFLPVGETLTETNVTISDDVLKNDCFTTLDIDYHSITMAQKRALKHIRILDVAHNSTNKSITVTCRSNKILSATQTIPCVIHVFGISK